MVQLDAQIFSRLRRPRRKSEFRTSSFLLIHHLQVRFKGRCLIKTGHPPAWMPGVVLWWNLREPPRNKPNRSTFNWNSPEHISNILYIYIYIHSPTFRLERKIYFKVTSGKLTCGKSPCVMSKSTMSMTIFNNFLYVYQRVHPMNIPLNHYLYPIKSL